MGTSLKQPTVEQLALRKSLEEALRANQNLPAIEMLAVVSHFVGQLIALQDQTKYTSAKIMDLVSNNILQGNEEVIKNLLNNSAGNA